MWKTPFKVPAKDLAWHVHHNGGFVWNDNGRLAYRLPAELNQEAWRQILIDNKDELLAYLEPTRVFADMLADFGAADRSRAVAVLLDMTHNEPQRITAVAADQKETL